jgi:hypothetical protein
MRLFNISSGFCGLFLRLISLPRHFVYLALHLGAHRFNRARLRVVIIRDAGSQHDAARGVAARTRSTCAVTDRKRDSVKQGGARAAARGG